MIQAVRYGRIVGGIVLAAFLIQPAFAQKRDHFETAADYSGLAVAIDRQLPDSPRHRARRLQEAWVQVSYVVTADGRAIDPIVINSSGGIDFENEVRKVTENWRFEENVTSTELPYNIVNTRFTVLGKGKGVTRKFARYSRHIMVGLHGENVELARKYAEEAIEVGGWNLYESTILWLMVGRIEGAEGDDAGQLEMYKRGLAVSDERSLQRDARIDLLEKIFKLESKLGHYAAALTTLSSLKAVSGSADAVSRLASRAAEIEDLLANDDFVVAAATITAPCDCDEGTALWSYAPARRTFSFVNLSGNVKRFEARCELQRISANVVTDQKWSLPMDWGYCQVFVFGDGGATFDFLGHSSDNNGDKAGRPAVARNHVLDRRSRSQ
jgi:hypothetical protein